MRSNNAEGKPWDPRSDHLFSEALSYRSTLLKTYKETSLKTDFFVPADPGKLDGQKIRGSDNRTVSHRETLPLRVVTHAVALKIGKYKDQVLICQICKLSIQDLSLEEIELAHCRMCSSHYSNQEKYVCSKCYEISSHISANCYMSVVDIT